MSSLITNFNVPPYFDDYEEAKNYYRILFRPSVAVQARELTQIQTIQQKQIERIGNYIFKGGSYLQENNPPIATQLPNLQFVRVLNKFISNTSLSVTDIPQDYLLVGQTSGARATVITAKVGAEEQYPDTNRFYVAYLATPDNNAKTFASNEIIKIYNSSQNKFGTINEANLFDSIRTITSTQLIATTGAGFGLRIESGIVYQKGFFQKIEDTVVIVRDYDQTVTNLVVGFETLEEIITENNDSSLTDNALGYSNENAPGAHRLKLTPVPVVRNRTEIKDDDTFFSVFEFSNISNRLVLNNAEDPLNRLGEILNNRTYEESGDYVVKEFVTDTIKSSNPNNFIYIVSSGIGYVRGKRIQYDDSNGAEVEKALTTAEAQQEIVTANYGNYIIVQEVSGTLNFSDFVTVDIYDTASTAITRKLVSGLTPLGAKIGTAKVKAILFNEGDAGLPTATYRLYISNIVMNTGKSFTNDAKAFYLVSANNGNLGNFFADIVLDNNTSRAILVDTNKNSLVFPFSKSAIKTLRSDNGTANYTEFKFRATSISSLAADGTIQVTVPVAATGGIEKLDYSISTLTDSAEKDFVVTLTANATTANIPNKTLSVSTGSAVAIGTGLLSVFTNGEFIAIKNGALATDYKRIISCTDTQLTLDSNPSFTNTVATFSKHFPAGYNLPLSSNFDGTRNITVTSDTTFTVNIGWGIEYPQGTNPSPAVVQYRMLRTQATQARKEIRKDRYVKLWANTASNGSWNLGIPDVLKVKSVYASTSYNTTPANDITSYFTFDSGQKPDQYDHATLILKPQYKNYFSESGRNNYLITVVLDHFEPILTNGVGFFSIDSYPIDDVNLSNISAIQTAEIPFFNYEGNTINLRDAVDFRPHKIRTADSVTSLASATINPATSSNYVSGSSKYLLEPDSNFQADIEYYLGRKDLITLNIAGALNVVKGTPSENPKIPQNTSDTMILAVADVPPYPTLTPEEAALVGRPNDAIKTEIYTNRVYTMRDIGVLDERIQNLEYYTSLAALELAAKDLAILDENKANRFKNGIFVDPMTSYDFHETNDIEYSFTLDQDSSYGRSPFKQKEIELEFDTTNSTGVQKTGSRLTRPYTEELFIFQPFATKFRNNAQDFWSWNGNLDLYPGFDVNRTVQQGTQVDFQFRIFIASRTVSFVATGLKPNTRVYPYFDDVAVSVHCAPARVNTQLGATLDAAIQEANRRGRPEDALVRTANFGQPLVTDSNGTLLGMFRIPADTFRVGDRRFSVLDVDNLELGADAALTQATATFTGFNVGVTTVPPPPPPRPRVWRGTNVGWFFGRIDPLAQSFFIEAQQGQSGVFITKLDLFFKKKDPNLGFEVVLVGMNNGYPDYSDVKGKARVENSQIFVSDNASVPTTVKFNFPVFLTSNKSYAFYVAPDGNSPEFQMWVSEVGDFDIVTRAQVFQNPYSGDLFRSSNAETWVAIPTEDVKFNLYVANFQVGSGTVYFQNEADDFITVNNLSVVNGAKPIEVNHEVYKIVSAGNPTIVAGYADREAYIQKIGSDNTIILNNSKGAFRASDVIGIFDPPQQGNSSQCNTSTLIATATIQSVDSVPMHALVPKILADIPAGTTIDYFFKGATNTAVVETAYTDVVSNQTKEITDFERAIYSSSKEDELAIAKTLVIKAVMTNSNKYVSPIIDLTSKSVIAIENDINNDSTNEDTRYGNAIAKYVSKPVVLADRQDAEDFVLYLTGYRPINTDILVYAKFLSSEDPSSLDSKVWTKLTLQNPSLVSSTVNNLDFKEYVYGLPTTAPSNYAAFKPAGFTERVRYQDSSGAIYFTFKSFIIKIVLLSSNKINVPKVKDIRGIALQL